MCLKFTMLTSCSNPNLLQQQQQQQHCLTKHSKHHGTVGNLLPSQSTNGPRLTSSTSLRDHRAVPGQGLHSAGSSSALGALTTSSSTDSAQELSERVWGVLVEGLQPFMQWELQSGMGDFWEQVGLLLFTSAAAMCYLQHATICGFASVLCAMFLSVYGFSLLCFICVLSAVLLVCVLYAMLPVVVCVPLSSQVAARSSTAAIPTDTSDHTPAPFGLPNNMDEAINIAVP